MNREVKFRLWDTNENEFVQPSQIAVKGNGEVMADTGKEWVYDIDKSDFILMQYTGLKDKNGKEIYEGDVVSIVDNHNDTYLYEIKWRQDTYCLVADGGPGEWLMLEEVEGCEIIGNIYQNPELLK